MPIFYPRDDTGYDTLAQCYDAKIKTCLIFSDVDAWCEWAFTHTMPTQKENNRCLMLGMSGAAGEK